MTHFVTAIQHSEGWGWTCICGQERPNAKSRSEGAALGTGRGHARRSTVEEMKALEAPCATCGADESMPCTKLSGETQFQPHNGRGGYKK